MSRLPPQGPYPLCGDVAMLSIAVLALGGCVATSVGEASRSYETKAEYSSVALCLGDALNAAYGARRIEGANAYRIGPVVLTYVAASGEAPRRLRVSIAGDSTRAVTRIDADPAWIEEVEATTARCRDPGDRRE